jgi:hypothetical protein
VAEPSFCDSVAEYRASSRGLLHCEISTLLTSDWGHQRRSMLITVADKCLLYSESDRIAAWPRNDVKCQQRKSAPLDHLAGNREQYRRYDEAERFRVLEVAVPACQYLRGSNRGVALQPVSLEGSAAVTSLPVCHNSNCTSSGCRRSSLISS